MGRVISTTTQKANKDYNCDACYWWNKAGFGLDECESIEQMVVFETAEKEGFKILRGQKYIKQIGINDGELCVYRARIDMNDICHQLDVFPDS